MLNEEARLPMMLVIAGPNGSGKSTITSHLELVGTYTNADDIAAALGISNEAAAKLADKKRYASIARREDFSFETVLSSEYKIKLLQDAKNAGYFIKCIFVLTVDPRLNVARVESRVASGGHSVEREKIIKRYHKSLGNIKRLIELCDILHVYDNTGEGKPVRIIRKRKEDISIFPNDLWGEEQILRLLGDGDEEV